MKTETQMYEEYIATQQARLEALVKEAEAIKKDIDNVQAMMVACPYESNTKR